MKKAARAKGTRDFLPQDMRKRQYVINVIRSVFERYGYEPMETPSLERWDVLKGKFGDEGEQLLFKVMRRGGILDDLRLGKVDKAEFTNFDDLVDLALRYDLTVPFSRVLAMNTTLPKPFKRYQIQPVWRADRPQKGRFREFYQCDVDVAGTTEMVADAEIIAIKYEALTELGFDQFRIRVNHRKLLNGLVNQSGGGDLFGSICIAIDKLDKIGKDGVKNELLSRGVDEEVANRILAWTDISGHAREILPTLNEYVGDDPEGLTGLDELRQLYEALEHLGVNLDNIPLDLSLVRGLDYYTGPIFETAVDEPAIGSLGGGGRYDNLIEKFSGQSVPAVGGSIGLERIIVVMEELGMLEQIQAGPQVLVTTFKPETMGASLEFAQIIRAAGIKTEFYLKPGTKLQRQFRFAGDAGIPIVAILGPDEIKNRQVTLRTDKKNQQTVSYEDAPQTIRNMLEALSN
jgi:histidyl-tRNA synthetase